MNAYREWIAEHCGNSAHEKAKILEQGSDWLLEQAKFRKKEKNGRGRPPRMMYQGKPISQLLPDALAQRVRDRRTRERCSVEDAFEWAIEYYGLKQTDDGRWEA